MQVWISDFNPQYVCSRLDVRAWRCNPSMEDRRVLLASYSCFVRNAASKSKLEGIWGENPLWAFGFHIHVSDHDFPKNKCKHECEIVHTQTWTWTNTQNKETLQHTTPRLNLKEIMQSGMNQIQKNTSGMIPFIWNMQKNY